MNELDEAVATGIAVGILLAIVMMAIVYGSMRNDTRVGPLKPNTCHRVEYKITPPDDLKSRFVRIPCPTRAPK